MLFLPPAYVVRREGNVLTSVCTSIHDSVCPQGAGGGGQVSPAGGGGVRSVARGGVRPVAGGGGGVRPVTRGGGFSWGGGVSQDRTTE